MVSADILDTHLYVWVFLVCFLDSMLKNRAAPSKSRHLAISLVTFTEN